MLQTFGLVSLDEFLGDNIVFRNLIPVASNLPALDTFRDAIGLAPGRLPRKQEADYARAIVHLLQQARAAGNPEVTLKRLIVVGDTRENDGVAFANICRVAGWPGLAFIGTDATAPAKVEVVSVGPDASLYLANRWAALADFDRFCAENNFPIDSATAIVLDVDKTILGARGRNAHVIDQARMQAVYDTVANLLGDTFDETRFRAAYRTLDNAQFYPLTADNQDYLAYICLIVGTGLYDLETVVADFRAGELVSFGQFIEQVNGQAEKLTPTLAQIHGDIYACVKAGDPTPFKMFRRNEYRATVSRMGFSDDAAPVETLLANEIVITQEVRSAALAWQARGALLFGLSDKPDEASIPTALLAGQGFLPLHRTKTHAVGEK